MKRLVIIFLGILIIFQSCLTASKKASRKQNVEYMPNLPYRALNKGVLSKNEPPLDTTFDYKVLEKIIDAALPKNIFGTKAMGTAEFYSMIDTNKHVVDIKLIECEFYKKGHLVYNYKENSKAEADSNLKKYLLELMQSTPFVQNKPATLPLHPTYCFVRFYQ